MELQDLAWAGPAGVVLTWGLGYLFCVRRRAPRATRLAMTAILLGLGVYVLEATLYRRVMERVVFPRGGLFGLSPANTWVAGAAVLNTVKAVLVGLLVYAVALDRRPPPADDD